MKTMSTRNTPARRSPLWWVATPLCLAYAAGVFVFFALRFLLPVWPPLLVLVSFLGPFLYAPLILLLPLAIFSRARAAIAATLAVVALFLGLYLPLFLPRAGAAPPATGPSITAMAFNLGPGISQPAGLTEAIARVGADLVALEELYPGAVAAFDAALAARYPYRILPAEQGASGLLSRCPILAYEFFRPAGIGRAALQASLEIGGLPAHVFVLHPEPPIHRVGPPGQKAPRLYERQLEAQLADVIGRAAGLAGPVLVMGDFNMGDQGRSYVVISSVLGDAFREAGLGFGFTFPVNRGPLGPLVRIDYIFHNDALYARRAYVGCNGGSDHCYVVAEFSGTPPATQPEHVRESGGGGGVPIRSPRLVGAYPR